LHFFSATAMLDLWAELSPLSPQNMYVTLPLAVQRGIGAAADPDVRTEWLRANTLWVPTMQDAMSVSPSSTINRFFTLVHPSIGASNLS
jgi:hypothetical protein